MPADPAVVGDHHEVVDFRSGADPRRAVGPPIDRGVGTDLDIVTEFHPAELRGEDVAGRPRLVTEAMGAEHGPGMNDASLPDARPVVEHGIREDLAPRADPAAGADSGARVDRAAGGDLGIRADGRKRVNIGPGSDPSRWIDRRLRAHAAADGGAQGAEVEDRGGKRRMDISHLERGAIERATPQRHDHGTSPALGQKWQLVDRIDERDLAGAGGIEGGGPGDNAGTCVNGSGGQRPGQSVECDRHRQASLGLPARRTGGGAEGAGR